MKSYFTLASLSDKKKEKKAYKAFMHFIISVFLLSIIIISIRCSNNNPMPGFKMSDIDTIPPNNPWVKIAADLDKDGLPDIIIGGQKGPLVWYKSPQWTKFKIAEDGYNTVDGEACDLDKDGDFDLVLGGLVWFENPGDLISNPEQIWRMHRIADHLTHDIEIADINMDGLSDVISRNQSAFSNPSGNTIHIWYQTTDTIWTEEIINCPHGEGIKVVDLDKDNDADIITGGIWYENQVKENHVIWKEHQFAEWHPNASVDVGDINEDGRNDIVLTPAELAKQYYKISWFEAPTDIQNMEWTEHLLADSVECVIHSLRIADFDLNGLPDILYAEMHQGTDPDEVVILYNEKQGKKWKKQILSDKGSHCLQVLDFDNDGDIDFFGANWSGNYQPLQLWENTLKVIK